MAENRKQGIYIGDLSLYEHTGSLKGEHYSHSFIDNWSRCPAKIAFSVVLDEEDKAEPLVVGRSVHSLLERKYSGCLTDNDIATEKAICGDSYYKVEEYLAAYDRIAPYDEFDDNSEFFTEKEFIADVRPLGVVLPAKIKGFVDRIDVGKNGIFVIDYKTSKKKPSKNLYRDQLIMYKWLVESELGVGVNKCYAASLYKESPRYIEPEMNLVSESKLIDKIFEIDKEVKSSMKSGLYKKKPGFYCRFCPAAEYCKNNLEI